MSDRHPVQEPTLDEYGAEVHPAFGMIGASRVSSAGGPHGGKVLFDSEVTHGHYVVLRVGRATRKRENSHDWIHEKGRGEIVEVAMSEAQWASFVSSMNTSGVPCTIERTEADGFMPGLPHAPRLALSREYATEAARRAFEEVDEALAAVEEKPTKANVRNLRIRLSNAVPNIDYASRKLAEHAEDVVQKARADVEAMVTKHAERLGLDPADLGAMPAIEPSAPAALTDENAE